MVFTTSDPKVLRLIFEIMNEHVNEDRYVLISLPAIAGELRKRMGIGKYSPPKDSTVRNCIDALRLRGYLKAYGIKSWSSRENSVSDKLTGFHIKLCVDEVTESMLAEVETTRMYIKRLEEENASLREKVREPEG